MSPSRSTRYRRVTEPDMTLLPEQRGAQLAGERERARALKVYRKSRIDRTKEDTLEDTIEVVDSGVGPQKQEPGLRLFGDGGSVRLDVSRGPGLEWVRLNDLHAASGGEKRKAPNEWLRTESAQRLIAEHTGKTRSECFHVVNGGNNGGTWAHWKIALAYAEWLSPTFHLSVLDDWRRYQEGGIKPDSQIEARLERMERLFERLTERLLAPAPAPVITDGSVIRPHDVAYLKRQKKDVVAMGVRLGFWKSKGSANRSVQSIIEEETGWGGKGSALSRMPANLFTVADRCLRKIRIDLERMDAIKNPRPSEIRQLNLLDVLLQPKAN